MIEAARENDALTEKVIGLAIEVHRHLGPGLLEGAYEECLCHELKQTGIVFKRQVAVPVVYKSVPLGYKYRLDLVIENQLIVEAKSVERLMPVHEAQVITYLRITGIPIGLLLNFNTDVLKNGIRRLVLKS